MSINVNKNNIYVIVPNGRYELSENIGDFMESSFTLFIRAKINVESIEKGKEGFLFSRNGKHAGLCSFLDNEDRLWMQCVYWLSDENNNDEYLQIRYEITKELQNEFNDYIITCDDLAKKIYFYVNKEIIGEIDYSNKIKQNYSNSFIWLGCGDMLVEENMYNGVGDFDIDKIIALDKYLDIKQLYNIINIYQTKYLKENVDFCLPVLSNNTPFRNNYKLFCDFEYKNIYKIWNMIDNGVYFQKYIKGNIYF